MKDAAVSVRRQGAHDGTMRSQEITDDADFFCRHDARALQLHYRFNRRVVVRHGLPVASGKVGQIEPGCHGLIVLRRLFECAYHVLARDHSYQLAIRCDNRKAAAPKAHHQLENSRQWC